MRLKSPSPAVLLLAALVLAAPPLRALETFCQDGIDNDSDGRIDANAAGVPSGNLGPDPDCQCLNDIAPSLNCTANDISFVLIGLGNQTDGCVNASDTVDIQMGATLATTATTRYDVSMWVALDGGDGRNGLCGRQILVPADTFGSTPPTAAELNSGNGPFRNEDNDVCGDLRSGDNPDGSGTFNARYFFKDQNNIANRIAYTFTCGAAANGLLGISNCIGYDNNAGTACPDLTAAVPGTSSKCRCETSQASSIPVPNLALQCGCTYTGTPGRFDCNVTYTNTGQGTCNQVSSASDTEFGCGVGRFLRFKTTYPSSVGSITTAPALCIPTTSGTTTANCNTGPGRGSVSDNGSGTITWTPRSDPGVGTGTLGWIGVNETERMRFTYTQNNTSTVTSLQFPTTAYWSDASGFASEVAQSSLTCSVTLTTPVTFAGFKARRDGDDLVLRWSTATETGNAGFHVYVETKKGTRRLNDRLIPSRRIDSLEPLDYAFRTPAAGLGKAKFYIEEVSTRGITHKNGPFTVRDSFDGLGEMQKTDWTDIRAEHENAERGRERQERGGAAKAAIAAAAQGGPSATPPVDLLVNKSGLYRVTYEQLAAAGFDLSRVKGEDLSLTSGGAPVPLYVGGSKFFGPGSYVEFYGKAVDTLYTDTNVYRLAYDKKSQQATVDATAPNASTPAAASYMETTRVERDTTYSFSAPNGDPWYDRVMGVFGSPASTQLTIDVDNVVAGAATLNVGLWGFTDWPQLNDHHVVLSFNGSTVADDRFDGVHDHPVTAGLASGVLQNGSNVLTVAQPADAGVPYEFIALDRYSVTYPRAFVARDNRLTFTAVGGRFVVSGLTSPNVAVYRDNGTLTRLGGVQVTGAAGTYSASFPGSAGAATYYVSAVEAMLTAGLRAARDGSSITVGPAQYLIVSHPDFIGGLGPLVNARQAQGFSVKTVDVRDVYARFSHGVFDAKAIKDYVAHAAANMGTKYVLLVGGDTYDYRNFTGNGSLSFIPSLYAVTGPYVAFAPVDSLAADVTGDGIQDLAIGRFPVRTAAELDQMIGRTLDYQHKSYRRSAVFAADAFDPDSATSFTVLSDGLLGAVPSDWSVSKAYLDQDNVAVAKGKLVEAIEGGVALTHFIGHSGPTNWTYRGLFNSGDAAALGNGGRPTIISQLGCWNAYYVSPTYDTLAHRFLLSGDRGAAAVLGPTTLTETDSEREFGEALTPLLTRPGTTIGDAVVAAKRITSFRRANAADVLLGFTILGDPALAVDP